MSRRKQTSELSFYSNDYGTFRWTAEEGVPNTGLGSYAVDFIPNDTANYDWASDSRWILDRGAICECVNINVAKATVTEPTIASKVYTGDELTAEITDSDIYTVTTNEGGTNVGNYDVVLTLKDVANYKWETDVNGTSDTVTLSFTIDQAENSWTTAPSIEGWTYGQTANTPTYEAKFGDDTVIVTYTGTANDGTTWNSTTAPSKAGNYKAIFTVDATDNYGRLENAVEFTIEKAVPALGTVLATITDNSTSISDITLSRTDSSVDGILTVDAGQTLVWGANEIAYTFTPTDTHNYKTVTGKTTVTVKDTVVAPHIQGEEGKMGWEVILDEVEDVLEEGTGETVVVDMNGFTEVPGDFFEEIKGKDITVEFDLGNGIVWTVNGKDITGEDIAEIDFAVTISTEENPISNIPAQVINQVTGENYHMEISLAYDGEFGFTAVLSLNLKAENAGCFANLYYYNVAKNAMEFICTDEIAADGTADLTFTHASDYTIVITDESADAEEPETSDTGDSNSVALWTMLLMAGFGFVIAGKKRRVK